MNHLGRFGEARQTAARALAVFERETDPDGIFVKFALATLGIGYLEDGMADQALPLLERAAENREASDSDLLHLGELRFALGRALTESKRDLVRGRSLVLRAQDDYARAVPSAGTQRALARISLWLSPQPL